MLYSVIIPMNICRLIISRGRNLCNRNAPRGGRPPNLACVQCVAQRLGAGPVTVSGEFSYCCVGRVVRAMRALAATACHSAITPATRQKHLTSSCPWWLLKQQPWRPGPGGPVHAPRAHRPGGSDFIIAHAQLPPLPPKAPPSLVPPGVGQSRTPASQGAPCVCRLLRLLPLINLGWISSSIHN